MANLRLVHEDFFTQVLEDYFVYEDSARVLGFDNIHDLLGCDHGLDVISGWMKNYPGRPILGKHGSGAMIEEARFYQ